jgi:hypothetical protein
MLTASTRKWGTSVSSGWSRKEASGAIRSATTSTRLAERLMIRSQWEVPKTRTSPDSLTSLAWITAKSGWIRGMA